MRNPEPALVAAVLIGALLLGGCGPSIQQEVPYLAQVQASRMKVRGANIRIRFARERPARVIAGELIAADIDSVWVLSGDSLTAIPSLQLPRTSIELSEGVEPWLPPLLLLQRPDPWSWPKLARHARFPQGIPPGLDRSTLAAP